MAETNKVNTSALAVLPPKDLWEKINAVRSEYDPAYPRWMPHINLVYPFVPEDQFEDAAVKVANAVRDSEKFVIKMDGFNTFSHGKRSRTMFLDPTDAAPIVSLQGSIVKEFPDHTDLNDRGEHGFTPHMTVAKLRGSATKMDEKAATISMEPLEFEVDRVYLIARGADTPFEIKHEVIF